MPVRPLHTRPWWVATVSGMASYIDSAAITGFSTSLVILRAELGLEEWQVGAAAASLTLSIAVGALVGGRLGDRFGRRPVFTVTMMLIIAAAVALILAPSFTVVIAGAVLLGFATGADLPVSLATIAEAATDDNRGRLLGFSNLLWIIGIVANTLLASVVGDWGRLGAQVLFGHIGVVALLVLLGRLTIPESASWTTAREERRAGIATVRADRSRITDLLRAPYAVPFLALMAFYALTGLVANTSGQFGTYILVTYGGATVGQAALIALPMIPIAVLGYLWFMKIADGPRRFLYFQIGAALMIVSKLVVVFAGLNIVTYAVSALLAALGGAFAFEGIMKVWTQEAFPTLLRSTAQGAIISVGRFSAAGLAAVTPLLLQSGVVAFYLLLTAFNVVGLGIAWAVFRRRTAPAIDTEASADPEATGTAPVTGATS
ncbi:MFS transporter [Microbacterium sp. 5K110]|uniref:MFS transporter n=1 Tax=unclassified Microbacterium TaxID=2609290 RepID=UPI0010FDC0AB|nr:MFS transporter [Microbacterium sp. 5K110]TLF27691.1 MFS transporter [Microbacterium sp. 5K110]